MYKDKKIWFGMSGDEEFSLELKLPVLDDGAVNHWGAIPAHFVGSLFQQVDRLTFHVAVEHTFDDKTLRRRC